MGFRDGSLCPESTHTGPIPPDDADDLGERSIILIIGDLASNLDLSSKGFKECDSVWQSPCAVSPPVFNVRSPVAYRMYTSVSIPMTVVVF